MQSASDFDVAEFVDVLLREAPGEEKNPTFLEALAASVYAGKVPDVDERQRGQVSAELRRRALRLRN